MKRVVVTGTLLLGTLLAGCSDDPANPNLLAPKVLVQARPDGNATVYVHSAFGEHDYDWISLGVDNQTVRNVSGVFSLEENVPGSGFFLHVRAAANDEQFEVRGRVDLEPDRRRARVSFLDPEGEWDGPRSFDLPFTTVLGRVRPEDAP